MKTRRPLEKPIQLTLDSARKPTGRGGWRPGAGRPKGQTKVAHEKRETFSSRHPLHVTLRLATELTNLRRHRPLEVIRRAIAGAQREDSFRICHFNVLSNHLHLVVEAEDADALARGMQGFEVRVARGLNGLLDRTSTVFPERYHARALRTPREVRNVLTYVLLNSRHHAAQAGESLAKQWIDPCSSAAWFDGWARPIRANEPWLKDLLAQKSPTTPATSWLLTIGWRRWGLLAFDEVPGVSASRAERGASPTAR